MISKNLKKLRKKLKLSQEALARKARISYNTVVKIEGQRIVSPRLDTLKKLARALKITLDKLAGR